MRSAAAYSLLRRTCVPPRLFPATPNVLDSKLFTTSTIATAATAATMSDSSSTKFPVQASITESLTKALSPLVHLQVINESYMHKVPKDSETHFKVVVVSEKFNEVKSPVERHRLVNAALAEQLAGPVHALSIVAKTPSQWETMLKEGKTAIAPSPNCRGGDGSLQHLSSAK